MNDELFNVVGFEFSNREPLAWSRFFSTLIVIYLFYECGDMFSFYFANLQRVKYII
ncbi:hypothetical protein LEP1GSC051_2579 [Leptospira sp. P2653]|uniref:Uncharacterized protein n=1 Tax=Leptospira weilii str. UI 13098 TaxID=1088542 RepID=M6QA38_9LEPT|nr:hypothetical protein LEP1GSC051_2579 [Leptospira sp. P2653]EMN92179.1 hypothetical protein LEP1GSC108_3816 [Leptospira weilii str. UI 13098]